MWTAKTQADLSLGWVHSHFVGFVMSWLIYLTYQMPTKEQHSTSLALTDHSTRSTMFNHHISKIIKIENIQICCK